MRLSIVTPSYNQGKYIEATLRSVLDQGDPDLEYIVMDGGSTDGTLAIVERYADRITYRSEPDRGQAHAVNKGLALATGDVLGWLNSDDVYLPGALATARRVFEARPEVDVLYGDVVIIGPEGEPLLYRPEIGFDYAILLYGPNPIAQPAAFWRRRAMEAVGPLDESLHQAMDWEWWLRMARAGLRFWHEPAYLAGFRWHSEAKSSRALPDLRAERQAVRARYAPDLGRLTGLRDRAMGVYARARRQWRKLGSPRTRRYLDIIPARLRLNLGLYDRPPRGEETQS